MAKMDNRTVKKRAQEKKNTTKDEVPEKKKAFIECLTQKYSVYHSCRAVGIGRSTAYQWRKDDKQFASDWEAALDDAVDALESSLYERAIKSDTTAAIFLLKGAKPDKYRERHESTQTNFDFNNADLSLLNDYELERLIAGDDPRSIFAAASKRRTREKAKAG